MATVKQCDRPGCRKTFDPQKTSSDKYVEECHVMGVKLELCGECRDAIHQFLHNPSARITTSGLRGETK